MDGENQETHQSQGTGVDWISQVQILRLEPEDVLVFKTESLLSDRARETWIANIRRLFGEDRKCLILDNGIELGVLRPTERRHGDD